MLGARSLNNWTAREVPARRRNLSKQSWIKIEGRAFQQPFWVLCMLICMTTICHRNFTKRDYLFFWVYRCWGGDTHIWSPWLKAMVPSAHKAILFGKLRPLNRSAGRWQWGRQGSWRVRIGGALLTPRPGGTGRGSELWALASGRFFFFSPSYIEASLTNKNCIYLGCTIWFFKVYKMV